MYNHQNETNQLAQVIFGILDGHKTLELIKQKGSDDLIETRRKRYTMMFYKLHTSHCKLSIELFRKSRGNIV